MAAVVAYSHPTELPSTLSIGTKKAFAGGYEYNYRVADDINMYVCDHQTTTKLSPPLVIRFLVLHVK